MISFLFSVHSSIPLLCSFRGILAASEQRTVGSSQCQPGQRQTEKITNLEGYLGQQQCLSLSYSSHSGPAIPHRTEPRKYPFKGLPLPSPSTPDPSGSSRRSPAQTHRGRADRVPIAPPLPLPQAPAARAPHARVQLSSDLPRPPIPARPASAPRSEAARAPTLAHPPEPGSGSPRRRAPHRRSSRLPHECARPVPPPPLQPSWEARQERHRKVSLSHLRAARPGSNAVEQGEGGADPGLAPGPPEVRAGPLGRTAALRGPSRRMACGGRLPRRLASSVPPPRPSAPPARSAAQCKDLLGGGGAARGPGAARPGSRKAVRSPRSLCEHPRKRP